MEQPQPDFSENHLSDFEPISSKVLDSLPISLIKKKFILPLKEDNGRLLVAVPKDQPTIKKEGLQLIAGCPVDLINLDISEITQFINKNFFIEEKEAESLETVVFPPPKKDRVQEAFEEAEIEPIEEKMEDVFDPAPLKMQMLIPPVIPKKEESSPLNEAWDLKPKTNVEAIGGIKFPPKLLEIISEGLNERANEVVLGYEGEKVSVRFRVRGLVIHSKSEEAVSASAMKSIFSEVKTKIDMNVRHGVSWAEWEGQFKSGADDWGGKISFMESKDLGLITFRFSKNKLRMYEPKNWGMDPITSDQFKYLLEKKQGVLIFCGSGFEVDHLYCEILRKAASEQKRVISIEGKSMEWIPNVEQFQTKNEPDYFSQIIDAAFQQSSDVMSINPLSTKENIENVFKAALRDTLTLARFDGRDAADALYRLCHMGVEPFLIGSSLNGIVAHQAIRQICPKCQTKDPQGRSQAQEMGVPSALRPPFFYMGSGCDDCGQTGYNNTINIFEIIEMNDDIRGFLSPETKPDAFRKFLKEKSFRTLRQSALRLAINGQTTLHEVIRTTP